MRADGSMALTQELFQILKRFSRLRWEKSDFQGLKRSEFEFLIILDMLLGEGTRAVPASELSNQMQITPAGVTHLINPLEEAGYVERLQDPNDRRVVLVGLTSKGEELAQILIREAHDSLVGVVKFLGKEDSQTLVRLMSSMITYLEALPESESGRPHSKGIENTNS